MHFLIYVDPGPLAEQAVRFAAPLIEPAEAAVTLLAVANSPPEEMRAQAALTRLAGLLPRPAETRLRPGRAVHELLSEAETGVYSALVIGSRGRRGWQRLAFGSAAARLARYSPVPVLIVKGSRTPRASGRRVLACSAGDARAEPVARWAGRLATWLGAELTLMHVMSQLALSTQAPLRPLFETAEEAIAERSREGQHLARQLEVAREAQPGVPARAKLRHGLVVDEVMAEADEGDYDLVVIGGHQAPAASEGWAPVRAYLLEDVADQIITALHRPVMVIKGR